MSRYRTMIVAKMQPDAAPQVAKIFAESDRGELPELIGVTGRSLFQFGEVYLHLIEAERPPATEVTKYAKHPEFRDVSARLQPYMRAYDPQTWREPRDAMAHEFYRWERDQG